jgi:hypothetical protein
VKINYSIFSPTPEWGSRKNKTSKRRNCYELANIHYELDETLKNWIYNNRPLIGREGDEYITLNKGDLFDASTGVFDSKFPPLAFYLKQNYPNPFNNVTNIQYQLLKPNYTTIKIYDILGKAIETIVSDHQDKGEYRVKWSAKDLSSGVYFYRLQSGNFSEVKKLVLQK